MNTIERGGARRRAVLRILLPASAGALLLAAFSCGGREPADGVRQIAMRGIATEVVVPSYRELAARAAELESAAAALAASPDAAGLTATRAAWRAARAAYQRCSAFAFGPHESLRITAKIGWLAIRPDRIEQQIADGDVFDADDIEDLGADRKGFLTLEYLLFEAGGEAATLQSLSGPAHAARRRYLAALAANLSRQTALLVEAWEPEGGNFPHLWVQAGRADGPYETLADALDALVNQMVFLAEDVADRQLLAPLGRTDADPPRPDLVATLRSAGGIADARNDVISIRRVYLGSMLYPAAGSLSSLVGGISPETDDAIRAAVAETIRLLDLIPPPLSYAVVAAPEAVAAAQARAAELRRYLSIDLVSVLGSTLRFNPSDGD